MSDRIGPDMPPRCGGRDDGARRTSLHDGEAGAIDITKDIRATTTFRNNSAKFLRHLRKTKRALVLTVNGKAAGETQEGQSRCDPFSISSEQAKPESGRCSAQRLVQGGKRRMQVYSQRCASASMMSWHFHG
jgi:hypothetical protein